MARDINLEWYDDQCCYDISFKNYDIVSDYTIKTSVYTQLGTQSRLKDYEQPNKFLQSGWVGNIFYNNIIIGSRFEQYTKQSDLSQDALNKSINEIKNSLQYLIDLMIAKNIEVTSSTNGDSVIFTINIIKFDGQQQIVEVGNNGL